MKLITESRGHRGEIYPVAQLAQEVPDELTARRERLTSESQRLQEAVPSSERG